MSKTVLYMPLFVYENGDDIEIRLKDEVRRLGMSGPLETVTKRLKPVELPKGTLVIADSPIRFGDSLSDVLKWLCEAVSIGHEIVIPEYLDLRTSTPNYEVSKSLLFKVNGLKRDLKSRNVKTGLFLSKLNGRNGGRPPLSAELVRRIETEYSELRSIRGLARKLKAEGIDVSRSSVERIVKGAGRRK